MKPEENKIPTVPLTRFLKHSLEILKNPLPFHHNNFERLGDTFRLKIGLKRIILKQFNRNKFELRKLDLYPVSPVVDIMNYGNIDLVMK